MLRQAQHDPSGVYVPMIILSLSKDSDRRSGDAIYLGSTVGAFDKCEAADAPEGGITPFTHKGASAMIDHVQPAILSYFYNLGLNLGQLASLPLEAQPHPEPGDEYQPHNLAVNVYNSTLWLYAKDGQFPPPNVAFEFARLTSIYGETLGYPPAEGQQPTAWEQPAARKQLILKAIEFQTVVLRDLAQLPAFLVPKVGIYDTAALIGKAQSILLPDVQAKVGEMALAEIAEAGKCLAFGVPTACGFHMMRATEDVLRRYSGTVPPMTGTSGQAILLPTDRVPSWGDYTAYLAHSTYDDVKEAYGLLLALKRNTRDELMHPELTLTPSEAYTVFFTGIAAIGAMARRMEVPVAEPAADDTPAYT